jgi:RNA polymerase sigma-70 factor (ECF subfamily)
VTGALLDPRHTAGGPSGKLPVMSAAPPARAPDLGERRLAARLREREPEVLTELYARYGRLTFGYLLRALRDRGAAEDVQQQVFLEVWERGPSYDPRRSSPATWIMTIARSRAIDHLRRRVPEPRDPAGALAEADAQAGPSDLDALHDAWWLAGALADLPDDEAEVLRLRFGDGLTQREIAARLRIPLGTVKTRMVRALERVRPAVERGS